MGRRGGARLNPDLYRRVVEDSPDALIFADPAGVIRVWNARAQALFGYAPDEAIGKSLDLIIPERLRARHWEGFDRTMATGKTRYAGKLLAVPAIRKDGSSLSVEFTITVLRSPGGELFGLAAILRDVTERWKRDRERDKRLADLEAKETAREGPKEPAKEAPKDAPKP